MNLSGITKALLNPQNYYDGAILGLTYMPVKPVAVATGAIASGLALYILRPESLLNQICVIGVASGMAWAATEAAHLVAGKLWNKRFAELKSGSAELSPEEKNQVNKLIEEALAAKNINASKITVDTFDLDELMVSVA